MRVLILGATGPTGILIVRELLASSAQYDIVIYARTPTKLPSDIVTHQDVAIIKGELSDSDSFSKAVEGVEAVLSALGPLASHPNNNPLAHGYKLLLELMQRHSVTRLIALGTASIIDENDKSSWAYSAMIATVKLLARNAYNDIVAVGEVIKASPENLRWTIVRVGLLTNAENNDVIVGYVGDGKTGTRLARAGYATFALQELEKEQWSRKAPLISSA